MLAWPHENTDWHFCLSEIERSYVELVGAICLESLALILCRGAEHQSHIVGMLPAEIRPRCRFAHVAYNDTWCRDYGPVTLTDCVSGNTLQLLDFSFTGWGNKYDASADNQVNQQLANQGILQLPLTSLAFDLEGGGIETDGAGTLLTTRHCFLNSERNPGLTAIEIEQQLRDLLGQERILWLEHGFLEGDDTDSHIDNLARFVSPDTVVHASATSADTTHSGPLAAMAEELRQLRTATGEPYRLIELPIPAVQTDPLTGKRLPGSYVNFLILNQSVIVPRFNTPEDAIAEERLRAAFPGKHIRLIDGRQFIRQYGGPHCATMQLPPGSLTE